MILIPKEADWLGRQEQPAKSDPADEVVEPDRSRPTIVQPGDLWLLGKHRLLCGDARDPASSRP